MKKNGKNSTRHIRMVFSILVLVFVLATGTPIPNLNGVVAYAKTKKENPKISKKRKNLKRKKSFTIKVSGTKKKVKWSVSDKSLVKLKKKGKNKAKITAKKKDGTCVVKAVVGGKSLYCLVSVNGSTKMSEKTRKWAVAGGFVKNKSDKTDSSKNSGSEEEKQDSTDGNKDKKPSGGSGTGGDKSDKTISDSDGPQKVKYVLINYPEISIMEGKSFQLTANAYPIEAANRSISWSSSNSSVATVDSTGKVVGIKPGTTTITATAKDGSGKSDSITATVTADPLKPVKEGLANAKKQGPEAFIRYCETGPYASKINIGIYGARYLAGMTSWDSDAIDAEADFGAALDALYKPWIQSIYEKSYASKTNNPLYKMAFMTGYISVMHGSRMTYCNRTYGWCLCPTIAPLLRDGITTTISGVSGYSTSQSYMGGNCAADARLLEDFAKYIGLQAECVSENGAYSHWMTMVTIGSDRYVFDATNNDMGKLVNGQLVDLPQDVWEEKARLKSIYGVQPYTP